MKIPIVNPTTILTNQTWISSSYSSGTSLTVKNTGGFADDDLILVGYPGQENTEITSLTATPPSVTTLTITAMNFAHSKDDPVYMILFNQCEIHESSNGTDYTLIATVNLDYSKMITVYEYLNGSQSNYYKIRLKNSVSGSLSSFSDAQLGTGWPRKSTGRMIRNVRRYLRDLNERSYQDWEIMAELKNAADEVTSEIPNAFWTLKKSSRTTSASTAEYYLPTDYRAMLFLLYTYTETSSTSRTYPIEYKPKPEFLLLVQDDNATDDDFLRNWTETPGDSDYPNGYFKVYPTPESADKAMTLWYFIEEPEFDSYGDLTNCPMPQVYEHYAVSMLSRDTDMIQRHESMYIRGLRQLKQRQRREFNPKQLIRRYGIDPEGNLYGAGAVRRTAEDKENYW